MKGVEAMELGRFDEGHDDGGGSAATHGACEEPVAAADGDRAHGPLGDVVRQGQAAVVEEARERTPLIDSIAHGLSQRRPGQERGQVRRHPLVKGIELWSQFKQASLSSLLWIQIPPGVVEMEELGDAGHALMRQPVLLGGLGDLEEFSSAMRHAADFKQRGILKQTIVARVGVGDQVALPLGQEGLGGCLPARDSVNS